ncbi:MAG: fibronectin type III domain-containing protein, partial [Nocardioidaceae bacterium]|nr:fibronectin type III domain-containing protein [Nocardioidaceae bacterium]
MVPASASPSPVPLRAPASSSPTSTAVPCASGLGPGTPTGLDVSVRAGAAVVTWKAPDASTHPVQNWLLAAADQEPPRGSTIAWQTVAAGPGCGTVSATVTGLVSGHRYAFWLEDVVISAEDGIPQAHLYGTAAPVVIP